MKTYTLTEINHVLKGEIVGNVTTSITAPEQLEVANDTEISFIGHKNTKSSGKLLKLVSQ